MNIAPTNPSMQSLPPRTAIENREIFQPKQAANQDVPLEALLPSRASEGETEQKPKINDALEAAISKVNDNFKNLQNQSSALEFTVDNELGRVIARLVDSETKEVIRQYPPEEMLEISRQMDKLVGKLLKENA